MGKSVKKNKIYSTLFEKIEGMIKNKKTPEEILSFAETCPEDAMFFVPEQTTKTSSTDGKGDRSSQTSAFDVAGRNYSLASLLASANALPHKFITPQTLSLPFLTTGWTIAHILARRKLLPPEFLTEDILSLESTTSPKGYLVFHAVCASGIVPSSADFIPEKLWFARDEQGRTPALAAVKNDAYRILTFAPWEALLIPSREFNGLAPVELWLDSILRREKCSPELKPEMLNNAKLLIDFAPKEFLLSVMEKYPQMEKWYGELLRQRIERDVILYEPDLFDDINPDETPEIYDR